MSRITTDDLRRAGLTVNNGQIIPIAHRKAPADIPAGSMAFDMSPLESKFLDLWTQAGGPDLVSEAPLIPGRLYRVDFFHPASKTCFELNGYRDHASRKGFARDNEKHLLLYLHGYQVVTLDRAQITAENIAKIIERLK